MCEKKLLQDIKCTGFPNHWLPAGTLFLIAPNPLQNVSLNLTILQLFNLFKEILIFPIVAYASLHYFWSNTVPMAFPGTKVLTLFFFFYLLSSSNFTCTEQSCFYFIANTGEVRSIAHLLLRFTTDLIF